MKSLTSVLAWYAAIGPVWWTYEAGIVVRRLVLVKGASLKGRVFLVERTDERERSEKTV